MVGAAFADRLYDELLAHKPLGEALVMARRRLMREEGNPLGLLYVLYGNPDVRIDRRPVTTTRITMQAPRLQLRSVSSESAGCVFDIYDGLTLGSGPDSGISFERNEVSDRHATFGVGADDVTITDLGSTNGTLVNGEPLGPRQPTKVSPGDLIQFGSEAVQLQVEEADDPASTLPRAVAALAARRTRDVTAGPPEGAGSASDGDQG